MNEIRRPKRVMIDIASWQTDTMALTAAERGALLSLKMFYWGTGPIPDRDQTIAQIAGMELKDWKQARDSLEPMFSVVGGEWFRADWNDELEAAYRAVKKASDASKAANEARWGKRNRRSFASAKVSAKDSDSDSGKDSDSDSDSHPPSVLKYTEHLKDKPPSQDKDVFDYDDPAIEQVISGLESGRNEKPFIMAGGFGAVEAEKGADHGL